MTVAYHGKRMRELFLMRHQRAPSFFGCGCSPPLPGQPNREARHYCWTWLELGRHEAQAASVSLARPSVFFSRIFSAILQVKI